MRNCYLLLILFFSLTAFSADMGRKFDLNKFKATATQESINMIFLDEFRTVVTDYWNRIESAKRNKNQLLSGYWYSNDYFETLQKFGQKNLTKWLMDRDAFSNGFVDGKKGLILPEGASYSYYLATNFKPAEVIKNINENGIIFIDCSMAYQLALYKSILFIVGEEIFNQIFNQEVMRKMPMLDQFTQNTMLKGLIDGRDIDEPGVPGTHYYFQNHFLYQYKENCGESQGFNVFVVENDGITPKFIGFGLDPKGVTADEIKAKMVEIFNNEPFNKRVVSEKKWTKIAPTGIWLELMNFLGTLKIKSVDDEEVLTKIIAKFSAYNANNRIIKVLQDKKQEREKSIKIWSIYFSLEKFLK